MECPACGFQNPEGMKFCGKCGSILSNPCIQCGFENPGRLSFCGKCGNSLEQNYSTTGLNRTKPQSYTPKHLADKILNTRSTIEGERKLVTVLFADVAGYTSISEKLDPEDVHHIMDGCFKILLGEIHKYEGTINQFTGDGVMALFGAPVSHEDHAQRACRAAITIQGAIVKYRQELAQRHNIQFMMRIGINSGLVVVGSIGDDLRMDYTAVGDTTNLAARMESAAKPGTIFLSENTQKLVKNFFELEPMGEIKVKGKQQLQKTFQLIKTGDIETRIGASVARGLTKFVGRKNSMAALMDAFDKIKSGTGQTVGIVGEAGVGKSRLLLEMENSIPQSEYKYIEGRCLQYASSILYLPVLNILKSIFNIKDGDKELLIKEKINNFITALDNQFSKLNPSFQDILSLQVDNKTFKKLEPKEKREKIFEAIRVLFIRMAQDKPLIITFEDVHWIDKTSEEFLNYFIDWLPNTQILLILLYRQEYTHQWGSKSYYTNIGVGQLGMSSSGELVSAILEEDEVAPELSRLILNRSAGNPLFMEEFTHTLLENGSITRHENKYTLKVNPEDINVPETIQGIIAARMDRLEDNLKKTMQFASVIGRNFAFKILQTITGMRSKLKSYLLNLEGLEFIYEKSLFPELEYIFKHALTQEVAYNSLLIKKRKDLHEKIGKAIEQIYQHRLEEFYEMLAYHYGKSNNSEKAYLYLKLSGKKATYNYSNWEALRFYREAIDILGRMPSNESNRKDGIQIRLSLSMPAMFLSYPEGSINEIINGVKLAKEIGDIRNLAKLNGTLSHAYAIKGKSILSIEHAEKCFQEAQKIQDLDLMAPVARDLTSAYMFAGVLSKAIPIFSTVIPLIETANKRSETFGRPSSVYTFICGLAGFILGILGSFDEAEILCNKASFNALNHNDLYELSFSEFSFGIFASQRGEGKLIVEHLLKCVKYLKQSQMTTLLDIALASLGLGYLYQGNMEKAKEMAEDALLASHKPEAASGNALMTQSTLAIIFSEVGDQEKAYSCATDAVKLSKEHKTGGWEGYSLSVLGMVLAKSETQRSEEAAEFIKRALSILSEYEFRPEFARGTFTLAEIYIHTGYKERALKNLKTAETMFKDMGMDYWIAQTYALYGKFYKKMGSMTKIKENLSKAIEILKECGADGWVEKYKKELSEL